MIKKRVIGEIISQKVKLVATKGKKGLLGLKKTKIKMIIATVSYHLNGKTGKVTILLEPYNDRGEKNLEPIVIRKLRSFLKEHTKEADAPQFKGSGCITVKWGGLFKLINLYTIMQNLMQAIEEKSHDLRTY